MSRFGAGGLGSYMGGGYDSPTQSTYAGNGQTILLLFVAAAVCMFLAVASIKQPENPGDTSGPGGPEDTSGTNGGISSTISSEDNTFAGLEMFDLSQDYANQAALDDMDLIESLEGTEAWISAGDTDLLLKMLENKTYGWGS